MILKFIAEDLISVILEEDTIPHSLQIEINYSRVNRMRNNLRIKGISSDLGVKELETISLEYPRNIHIESKSLIVLNNPSFDQHFKARISKYQKADFEFIKKIWEESK